MSNVIPMVRRRSDVPVQSAELSEECFLRAQGLAELLLRLPESEKPPVVLALLCLLKAGLRGC